MTRLVHRGAHELRGYLGRRAPPFDPNSVVALISISHHGHRDNVVHSTDPVYAHAQRQLPGWARKSRLVDLALLRYVNPVRGGIHDVQAKDAGVTLGAFWALWTCFALQTLRPDIALGPLNARLAVRTILAIHACWACGAYRAFWTLWTLDAGQTVFTIDAIRTRRAYRTLRTLDAGQSVFTIDAIRTRRACCTDRALWTLRTFRALRALTTGQTVGSV